MQVSSGGMLGGGEPRVPGPMLSKSISRPARSGATSSAPRTIFKGVSEVSSKLDFKRKYCVIKVW